MLELQQEEQAAAVAGGVDLLGELEEENSDHHHILNGKVLSKNCAISCCLESRMTKKTLNSDSVLG